MDFLQFAPLLKSVCLIDLYTYEMNFSLFYMFQILILFQINGWQRVSIVLLAVSLVYQLFLYCNLMQSHFLNLVLHSWTIGVPFRNTLTMLRPLSDIPIFYRNFKASGLTLRLLIHFHICTGWVIVLDSLFSMWNQIFPTPFVEETVISAMYVYWHISWEADGCRCTGLFLGPLLYFGLRVWGVSLPASYCFCYYHCME